MNEITQRREIEMVEQTQTNNQTQTTETEELLRLKTGYSQHASRCMLTHRKARAPKSLKHVLQITYFQKGG
jgi:hypothetical protein